MGEETFFLWGPRQTGKTTLLRSLYGDSLWIDLLHSATYRSLAAHPEELAEIVRARGANFVVIDEIQKVPPLLDEVHRLHEQGARFALCGSSARKVRRGHANLLGGRALRFELFGLVSAELGGAFDLTRMLNHGFMPRLYDASRPASYLRAYVADYLKEEVIAEGLVRGLGPFDDFLRQAALADTEPVSFAAIARDCGVSAPTVRAYYQILEDTLLGRFLPAYTRRPKRRITKAPKFYFADVGVVNQLAKRGTLELGGQLYGKAMESWVHHELSAYNAYAERDARLSYWRLSTGVEVDFVVDDMFVAIECKASTRVRPGHLKNLRELARDHPRCRRRILVAPTDRSRTTEDGIEILRVRNFLDALWGGELF
ncbi:MAG: ATP-binding protein [Deltaproteobacteria bacterium]|jgi:predicted AAA+ superfamily ATPase|nr:ATP-binding protein [Deltaproteobacteria bacterium]MBW2532522.1 ATP-binding protein [Deltaproteobacteria bacterium]